MSGKEIHSADITGILISDLLGLTKYVPLYLWLGFYISSNKEKVCHEKLTDTLL